jgi:hypothetical protein
MAYQITTPPAFLEPFGEKISDATVQQIGQPIDISKISPQVAQLSPLIQAAQQRTATQAGLGTLQFSPTGQLTGVGAGTGIAAYQPYLQAAEQQLQKAQGISGPTGYQAYMSPYQQEVIDATQQLLAEQRASGLNTLKGSQVAQGAFGQGRGAVAEAEYLRGRDISDAGILAGIRQQGLTEAQRLQQQDIANQLGFGTTQLGLGTQQQQFETGLTSQLGGAGAGAQTYAQSILDAIQQGNVLEQTFPLQKLGTASNIFGAIASGTPQTPAAPITTSPALVGAQTLAGIYGALTPSRTQSAYGGLMSLVGR